MDSKKLTLADLKPGESARITAVNVNGVARHRLMDFGFRCGEQVTMVRSAPLSDPIAYKLRGAYVSLRRAEANLIEVDTAQ